MLHDNTAPSWRKQSFFSDAFHVQEPEHFLFRFFPPCFIWTEIMRTDVFRKGREKKLNYITAWRQLLFIVVSGYCEIVYCICWDIVVHNPHWSVCRILSSPVNCLINSQMLIKMIHCFYNHWYRVSLGKWYQINIQFWKVQ